jgi:hypothetical protein
LKVQKVKYAERVPGRVERHCAAFVTQSGKVVIVASVDGWPFYNIKDAVRLAENIMKGKKNSTRYMILPGITSWETTTYDKSLVEMAKAGHLVNAVVIENVPDSEEELQRFAGEVLREAH